MKRMNVIFLVFFLATLTWAMYERKSKNNFSRKVEKLETEYFKERKDNDFLEDKIKSFENKIFIITKEKDELFGVGIARDDYISSLKKDNQEADETIIQLKEKLNRLEEILVGFQEEMILPQEE
ncbi:MAG: hypothetical protein P9M06_06715 [Candidatus Saelkia tenebricola]|nr:hypothetical protein [Candidatus Saelkia tenebricola]